MLRWLLILTMAVLPWHGWAGASLAAASAVQPQAVSAGAERDTTSQHPMHHPGQPSPDCLGDAGATAGHHMGDAADGGCPGCSMCQSCSPVGLPALGGVPPADTAAPQRPPGPVSRFASAQCLPGLKPPIS